MIIIIMCTTRLHGVSDASCVFDGTPDTAEDWSVFFSFFFRSGCRNRRTLQCKCFVTYENDLSTAVNVRRFSAAYPRARWLSSRYVMRIFVRFRWARRRNAMFVHIQGAPRINYVHYSIGWRISVYVCVLFHVKFKTLIRTSTFFYYHVVMN